MRKLLGKIAFLTVLTALFLTVTAFAAASGTGVVNADALRLRAEPSTDAATLTYLSSGAQLEILEDLGEWYKVDYQDTIGFVFAVYVDAQDSGAASVSAASGESISGKTGVITANDVNFRSGPSEDEAILTTAGEGAEMVIDSIADGWCKVTWDGQEGYVSADYLSVNGIPLVDPRGVVTGDCVNVRSAPTTESSIVTKVYAGGMVDLIALENDWYAVSVNGNRGYIRSDYLRVYNPGTASGLGEEIAAACYDYLGTRYSYGGASPKGFDCSGFTMYIYSLFGYSLPHSATSQWNTAGTYVERSDLQPGDLVLFCDPSRSNGKACSHVGIYVGDGEFIHASSSSTGYVKVSSLSENYYNGYYVGAKRVA